MENSKLSVAPSSFEEIKEIYQFQNNTKKKDLSKNFHQDNNNSNRDYSSSDRVDEYSYSENMGSEEYDLEDSDNRDYNKDQNILEFYQAVKDDNISFIEEFFKNDSNCVCKFKIINESLNKFFIK